MDKLRFWTVVLLLIGTVLLLNTRSGSEPSPPRESLSRIPNEIHGWEGTDQSIDSETLKVLGAGEFVSRTYAHTKQVPPVSLFVAYFPTQRTGATLHSPKHCLPGAGWVFESSQYVRLNDVEGRAHQIGEYIIGDGVDREYVVYWYQAHGRSVASEYVSMLYMVADAIRTNRSDGALVRVVTPIEPNEDITQARARAESFVVHLAPLLPRFIPN